MPPHVNKNLTMLQFNSSTPAKVPSCTMAPIDVEVDWIATTIQWDIEIYLARDRASSPVASQIEM
jgi:hypothetical protein